MDPMQGDLEKFDVFSLGICFLRMILNLDEVEIEFINQSNESYFGIIIYLIFFFLKFL